MKKRTVRRQWALVNPIAHAMGRAARLPQTEIDAQVVPMKEAIDRLVMGRWENTDWGAVRDSANRVEILMRMAKVDNPEFLQEIGIVVQAANARFRANGTKALYAGEIESLRWLERSYAGVLAEVTRGQFMDACTIVEREVKQVIAIKRKAMAQEQEAVA